MIQKLTHPQTPERPNGFQLPATCSPQPDLPASDMQVRVIHDWRELAALGDAWRRLVETALEPNAFYEPHFLLPALQHLADESVQIVVIEAAVRVCPDQGKVLCGLFPLQKKRSLRGLPFSTLEMWQNDYTFLTTPLIRRDVALPAMHSFLAWQGRQPSTLWHLPVLPSGGDVEQLITKALTQSGISKIVRDRHVRAAIVRRNSAADVLQQGLSRKRRHEINRTRRKLSERGTWEVDVFEPQQDPSPWIEQFLELETKGWKGRAGSNICQRPSDRGFFESMVQQAAKTGHLMMLRLLVEGRTIAMKINLLSEAGGFCFKIAYDEHYAKYSPGVLLEIENLNWLHQQHDCDWMDSCASPATA